MNARGVHSPMAECGFCAHRFEARLGKYGCPNCQASQLLATDGELLATCIYPECNCPFDMGPNDRCLRGLPFRRPNRGAGPTQ